MELHFFDRHRRSNQRKELPLRLLLRGLDEPVARQLLLLEDRVGGPNVLVICEPL